MAIGVHSFCCGEIKFARSEARQAGVAIPKISTTNLSPEEFAIFFDDEEGTCIEEGACCSYKARAQAIYEYIDLHKQEK